MVRIVSTSAGTRQLIPCSGAQNGMMKDNLREVGHPLISLNYADMISYTNTL